MFERGLTQRARGVFKIAMRSSALLILAAAVHALSGSESGTAAWTKLGDGPFSKREGLMAVSANGTLYLSGGRTTDGLGFAGDVWSSADGGASWAQPATATAAPFGARAYHNMVELGGCLYVLGGQTFKGYFNDVHRSCDGAGAVWEQVTANASWPVRAGAAAWATSAGEIVLAGGCYSDKGKRSFRADVWASKDGVTWEQRTAAAPWSARSGPRLVEFKGELYLVAGERGFTAGVQLADVWKSSDGGASWALVSAAPGFSARSGHGVVVTPDGETMLVVAGWPELHDVWASSDGATWVQTSDAVWNCGAKSCGKFDFWGLYHRGALLTVGGSGASATFGKLYADTWRLSA